MSLKLGLEPRPDSDIIVLDSKAPARIIWPVAGGKGGTGKSTLTANLGVGLSLLGYKVILVDGDLGGADLHLFFDLVAPPASLNHFLSKEAGSLADVVLPTPSENLKLICGGSEMVGLANLPHFTKEKLKRHIRGLDADYVLIDLGSGTSYTTLDFFCLSDEGFIVCTPEPQARVDAYGFVKNTVYRQLRRLFSKNKQIAAVIDRFARDSGRRSGRIRDLLELIGNLDPRAGEQAVELLEAYRPKLILNRVRTGKQIDEAHRFVALVREYLSTDMQYVGFVRSDTRVLDACERRRPLLIDSPKAAASRDLCNILMTGLDVPDRLHRFTGQHYRKMSRVAKAEARLW